MNPVPTPAAPPATLLVVVLRKRQQGDLVADLPPHFDMYAFVDRRYQHLANEGETWLCRYFRHGYDYVIPLQRLGAPDLLALHPSSLESLVQVLERHESPLARQWLSDIHAAQEGREVQASTENAQMELLGDRAERAERERDELRRLMADVADPARMPGQADVAHHGPAGKLESLLFFHPAYRARFSLDLSKLSLRPDPTGSPCSNGILTVPGLEAAHPKRLGPLPVQWVEDLGGYVVDLGEAKSPPKQAAEPSKGQVTG